jgi:hypothetical protein
MSRSQRSQSSSTTEAVKTPAQRRRQAMRDQSSPIARFIAGLKVDADSLLASTVVRPNGSKALPKRISASKVPQAPRPGSRTQKQK